MLAQCILSSVEEKQQSLRELEHNEQQLESSDSGIHHQFYVHAVNDGSCDQLVQGYLLVIGLETNLSMIRKKSSVNDV